MDLVICMWANADQWNARKSPRDLLRKQQRQADGPLFFLWRVLSLEERHRIAATIFNQPEGKPALTQSCDHHRWEESEPLRTGQSLSYHWLLLVWDDTFLLGEAGLVRFSSRGAVRTTHPPGEMRWAGAALPSPRFFLHRAQVDAHAQ